MHYPPSKDNPGLPLHQVTLSRGWALVRDQGPTHESAAKYSWGRRRAPIWCVLRGGPLRSCAEEPALSSVACRCQRRDQALIRSSLSWHYRRPARYLVACADRVAARTRAHGRAHHRFVGVIAWISLCERRQDTPPRPGSRSARDPRTRTKKALGSRRVTARSSTARTWNTWRASRFCPVCYDRTLLKCHRSTSQKIAR